jgi:hypothetical protein
VCGVVERVNKLVKVDPLQSRYRGDVGDLVVGRVEEVSEKSWKVDVGGAKSAILMLSSVRTSPSHPPMRAVTRVCRWRGAGGGSTVFLAVPAPLSFSALSLARPHAATG